MFTPKIIIKKQDFQTFQFRGVCIHLPNLSLTVIFAEKHMDVYIASIVQIAFADMLSVDTTIIK